MDPEEEEPKKLEEELHEPVEESETFILSASKVQHVWTSPRPREALVEVMQEHFRPKSSLEDEKMEYNEINILSEY